MTENHSQAFGELSGVEHVTTHGLPSVRVRTAQASGLVFLQGAHVAEWIPTGGEPVIWMSEKAVYQPGCAARRHPDLFPLVRC